MRPHRMGEAMEQGKLEELHRRLTTELAAVDRQLTDHGVAEDGIEVGLDEGFADSAQATAERSEIVGVARQLLAHRGEVAAALVRVESGTYGICENCGRPIDGERLAALPSARLCLSCKAAAS
jgi:RNA polymerase-binding transcription factor DksA